MYINDLPNSIDNDTSLFADDTSVLFTHSPRTDITPIINQQLVKLQNWADTWHVTLNPKKTKVMTLTTAKHPAKLSPSINGSPIETVTQTSGADFEQLGKME